MIEEIVKLSRRYLEVKNQPMERSFVIAKLQKHRCSTEFIGEATFDLLEGFRVSRQLGLAVPFDEVTGGLPDPGFLLAVEIRISIEALFDIVIGPAVKEAHDQVVGAARAQQRHGNKDRYQSHVPLGAADRVVGIEHRGPLSTVPN